LRKKLGKRRVYVIKGSITKDPSQLKKEESLVKAWSNTKSELSKHSSSRNLRQVEREGSKVCATKNLDSQSN